MLSGVGDDSRGVEGSDCPFYLPCSVANDWSYLQGGDAASQAAFA